MALLGLDGWTAAVVVALAVAVALRHASRPKRHPGEPPVVPPRIPCVGHLVGMALDGGRYIKRMGLSHPHEPILTLPVPGSRIYVVKEPSLTAAVQRTSKTLSFSPLVPDITRRVLGLDDDAVRIVRQGLDPDPGGEQDGGFLAEIRDMVSGSLGPGPYLDSISCEAVQELCCQLSQAGESLRVSSPPLDLLLWIRHLVTVGTARYLFGPAIPVTERPGLEDDFWAFDHGIGGLLVGILPSVTAADAYRGRERLVAGFLDYLGAGRLRAAARIIRDRMRIEEEFGFSADARARSCLSFFFASVVNTATTTFWVVLRLFADPALLVDVRREVQAAMEASEARVGRDSLSIGVVRDRCTTLGAVFRESLRLGSDNISTRLVRDDTLLAGRYLLKKGAIVQIAGGAIHADESVWGDDVADFNPRRFLARDGVHPAAFRGFGGGKTMCPGRHFATNEVLAFAALIVHAFDLSSPDGAPIRVPPKNDRVLPAHVLEPSRRDLQKVVIEPRQEAAVLRRLRVVA